MEEKRTGHTRAAPDIERRREVHDKGIGQPRPEQRGVVGGEVLPHRKATDNPNMERQVPEIGDIERPDRPVGVGVARAPEEAQEKRKKDAIPDPQHDLLPAPCAQVLPYASQAHPHDPHQPPPLSGP